jgi:serine/threonine-protein kinase
MQNYVGQQIDRYRITERLGMGGMAVVYKAYDTRLERDVALKLIRTESIPQDQHERLFKRFEREAKAQARFKHPHIVAVHDYGEVDNSPYLVMDFISGGTLKEHLKQGPMGWQQAVQLLIPVAEALNYAHQRGVIHRDVKPGNILFDEEGQPILTDFGIAKILETDEATLTGTGMGVGTPEYMAPEQWQGKTSAATDQYALGVVLYELITGRKPYTADTPAAVAILQATEPLAPPSKLVRGVPEAVEKVLYKALARDQQDRYENMEEFGLALRGLLAEADDDAELILRQKERRKPEPAPVPHVSEASESVTWDALDATPVEEPGPALQGKRGLPKWAPWAGIGILGLAIIGLAIGIGGNPVDMSKGGEGPLAMLATETATETITPTVTKTTTPTKTATLTPTPEPTLGIVSTLINAMDGAEMVYVPAGEFLMGSEDADAWDDEAPEHRVYLDDYWIYKYEVTNEQYAEFLNEMGNQTEGGVTWLYAGDEDANIHKSGGEWVVDSGYEYHPVVEVSWYGAQAYCEWAGGRLPTEAEWEKAARGEDGSTYPWGEANPNCNLAQYGNCSGETIEVGSLPDGASPYGALDMAGNVWEWVADWYDEDYYKTSPYENPSGPNNGIYRVIRGGSWYSHEWYLRASDRDRYIPVYFVGSRGFRCLSSP